MDDLYNISILSDIEENIEYGNELTDPFNILNIKSLSVVGDFTPFISVLDINKLYYDTSEFNEEHWEENVSIQDLLISEELKNVYLRFAWWLCNKIIYNTRDVNILNIKDIIKNNIDFVVKIFIYNSFNSYILSITLPNDSQLIIKFKDNTILL